MAANIGHERRACSRQDVIYRNGLRYRNAFGKILYIPSGFSPFPRVEITHLAVPASGSDEKSTNPLLRCFALSKHPSAVPLISCVVICARKQNCIVFPRFPVRHNDDSWRTSLSDYEIPYIKLFRASDQRASTPASACGLQQRLLTFSPMSSMGKPRLVMQVQDLKLIRDIQYCSALVAVFPAESPAILSI